MTLTSRISTTIAAALLMPALTTATGYAADSQPTPAQASYETTAAAAGDATATTTQEEVGIEPLISRRTCDVNESPQQIWIISTDGVIYCYGGTSGELPIAVSVTWLSPGEYHGFIGCDNGRHFFSPGSRVPIGDFCTTLVIRPGAGSAGDDDVIDVNDVRDGASSTVGF